MYQFRAFSEEEKQRASQTNLPHLLLNLGEKLKQNGKEYEWMFENQVVSIRENLWYHFYDQVGGDAISFVEHFFNKNYIEAVCYLLGEANEEPPISKTEFELPKRNDNYRRVFAYLCHKRKISKDILYQFIGEGLIYESVPHHNVVFIGVDKDGKACHAHKRSTASNGSFKCNSKGSIPEYSFHWIGTSNILYLFEAPIDLLSFISLHPKNWTENNYAACCGVSDRVLFQTLKDHPNIKQVMLCLDNDKAGQEANTRMSNKLFISGIKSDVLVPHLKDWNEDLINLRLEE